MSKKQKSGQFKNLHRFNLCYLRPVRIILNVKKSAKLLIILVWINHKSVHIIRNQNLNFGQVRPIYSQQDVELLIKTILKLMKNFRTLHDLRSNYRKEIFYCFPNLTHRKGNLYVHTRNTHTHTHLFPINY